jgi:GINS complex subunit 2
MDAVVPLWLATMLRRRRLARIVPPGWMDVDALRAVLKFERDVREASFSPDLPFRHAEVARSILSATGAGGGSGSGAGDGGDGGGEVPDADAVRLLLEDISAVRTDKIRRNVHQLSSSTLRDRSSTEIVIDVTNIGSLEMHAIRPFVSEAFRLHRELSGKGSSYNRDAVVRTDYGGGAAAEAAFGNAGGAAGGGRLRRSRLARRERGGEEENAAAAAQEEEEEEGGRMEEPRPLAEIERERDGGGMMAAAAAADDEDGEEADADADADADAAAGGGRSGLRRHR